MGKFSLSLAEIEKQISLVDGSKAQAALDYRRENPQLTTINPTPIQNNINRGVTTTAPVSVNGQKAKATISNDGAQITYPDGTGYWYEPNSQADPRERLSFSDWIKGTNTLQSLQEQSEAAKAKSLYNQSINSVDSELSADLQKWSNPKYKMTDADKAKFKEYQNRISLGGSNGYNYADIKGEQLDNFIAVGNKVNKLANFAYGLTDNPFGKLVANTYSKLGVDADKNALDELKEGRSNAYTQDILSTGAGALTGQIANYNIGSKVAQSIPALQKASGAFGTKIENLTKSAKLGSAAQNIFGDMMLDVALDTAPTTIENVQSGMDVGEVAKETAKNIGLNLAFNVGGEALKSLPTLKNATDLKPTKSADDIIKVDDLKEVSNVTPEIKPISVGKATTIQSPYNGEVPIQAKEGFTRVDITKESIDNARTNIRVADIDSKLNGRNTKKILTKVYESLFGETGEAINVPVEGLSFSNKPYNVTVNKNAVGKIVSDKNFSAEKLAIIDNIDNVIENSEYVGSGNFVNYKNNNKKVARYDYFETMCKIDGEDYIVSFDVEVVPGSNNYRTHKVINEINLSKANQLSTGTGPAPAVSVDSGKGLFNSNISNLQNNVNDVAEEAVKTFNIKDYPDATEAYKSAKKNIHNMFNMFGSKEQEQTVIEAVNEFVENPSIEKYIEVQSLLEKEADNLVGTEYHYKSDKAKKIGKTRKFDKEYDYMSVSDSLDELYNSVRNRSLANKTMAENIGAIHQSENVEIPAEGFGGNVSKSRSNTLKKSGINTIDELSNKFLDERNFVYETVSEKESMDTATKRIAEGVDSWKSKLMSQEDFTGADIDTMMLIYTDAINKARQTGDEALWKEAGTIFKKIQESGTKSGQAIQAFAKWSRNTPEGVVADTFRGIKEKIAKQSGDKKAIKIVDELTVELQKDIYELAETAFREGVDSRAGQEAFAQIGKIVNKNTPKSLKGIVKSYLMDSMLLNFRTLITRNAGGNLGYNAMEFARQPITAGIDAVASKFTGQRTRTGWKTDKIASAFSGLAKGIADEASDIQKGIHTSKSGQNVIGDAIYANSNPFKGNNAITKALNKIDDLTKHGLSVGDRPFYEAAYKQRLSELNDLRARGLLGEEVMKLSDDDFKVMAEMSAKIDGLTATYQDDAAMAKALEGLKSAVGKFSEGFAGTDVLSQFVMPFTRTPGNIITRSLEYSPYGLVKNTVNTVGELRKGNFNQQRFVDEAGRNILGTGLFAGGIAAYDNGLITGGYSDDKDMANAQKQAGMQEYALRTNIGGKEGNFDISWLPVLGNDLVAAAAFKEAYDADKENPLSAGVEGALTGANTLLNTSTLQGMNRMFGGNTSYSSEQNLLANAKDALTSGFGQAIPSIVRQAVQSTDTYQRNVSNGDREYWQNNLMASLPMLRQELQPKVDNEGNVMLNNQGRDLGSRVFENMVLPGKYTDLQDSVVNNEAMRLYNSTGNKYAFLPTANRKDISSDGNVTDKQFYDYQVSFGSKNAETAQTVIESDFYASLSDEQKEKVLQDVYSAMKTVAKEESVEGYSSDDKIAMAYKENGATGVVEHMQKTYAFKDAGIDSGNKVAQEYYDNGNFEEYKEIDSAIKSYGLDTNDESSIAFIEQYGLDKYKDVGDAIESVGLKHSKANRELYLSGGIPVLQTVKAADFNNDGSVTKTKELIPYLKNQNWTVEEKNRVVEQFGYSTKGLKW